MTDNTQIEVDPDALRRCGTDLAHISGEVKSAAAEIAANRLSGRAFGLMNAWMVPPIAGLASHSTDVITLTADISAAVGAAAIAAAQDFEDTEQEIISQIDALEAKLVGG
jgi:hypothetical protein